MTGGTTLKLFAALAALSLAGAALSSSRPGPKERALEEVARYRASARVTPDPAPGNIFLAVG